MKRKEKKTKKVKPTTPKGKVVALKKKIDAINAKISRQKGLQHLLSDRLVSLNEYQVTLSMSPDDSRLFQLKREISSLEAELNKTPILNLTQQLEIAESKLKQGEREIHNQTRERLIAEKKKELQQLTKPLPGFHEKQSNAYEHANKIIHPNWNEITFFDGFIRISHDHKLYEVKIPDSRIYLNKIKTYYSFKNVPPLEIVISNNHIVVTNQELLFFNIKFLTRLGMEFGLVKYERSLSSSWTKYTKAFYKRELPYLFRTDSLRKLCELCDDNLPIIPAGEVVINSKGKQDIHHSFLFAVKKSLNEIKVIWESEEESKATYIFNITGSYLESVQLLYEFIAGQTIINS